MQRPQRGHCMLLTGFTPATSLCFLYIVGQKCFFLHACPKLVQQHCLRLAALPGPPLVLQFQLTINVVAVAVAVTGAFVSGDSPLTAVQVRHAAEYFCPAYP